MHFNTKFSMRVLLGVTACTMCWSAALADSANTDAVEMDSSIYQDWADRTDISAKF